MSKAVIQNSVAKKSLSPLKIPYFELILINLCYVSDTVMHSLYISFKNKNIIFVWILKWRLRKIK